LIFLLSHDIWKMGKQIYHNITNKQYLMLDPSPLFTVVACMGFSLAYFGLLGLTNISSTQGKWLIGGLSSLLIFIIILGIYLGNPWRRFKKFEKDINDLLSNR
ncbi:MAG: hypothetical protein ACTSWL_02955, partial [Promethearchaeota archaeon]